jgi:two-component system, OmpR family, alkaline phosphatase synthesis response regulator PhoP
VNGHRVLIVEDDRSSREMLRQFLVAGGFEVVEAADGATAISRAPGVDVILLDVGLPDVDGWSVSETLRRELPDTPIVFVTGSGALHDKILGFRLGAEDYIVKPFDLSELEARLRVVLRRHHQKDVQRYGELTVDRKARIVLRSGTRVALTPLEFDLLSLLSAHPMRIWTREDLLRRVWDQTREVVDRTVDVRIRRIREALDDDAFAPRYIETVRGRGYRWLQREENSS